MFYPSQYIAAGLCSHMKGNLMFLVIIIIIIIIIIISIIIIIQHSICLDNTLKKNQSCLWLFLLYLFCVISPSIHHENVDVGQGVTRA